MNGGYSQGWVRLQQWLLDRKLLYYYLLPPDPYGKLRELMEIPIDQRFFKVATRYMNAYMEKGEMPPEQIAPVIFNLLDDYAAGRQMTLRGGDYIAMQTYLRAHKDA